MNTTDVKKARVSFALEQGTGNIEIRPAMRISNDGLAWDSPVVVGTPNPRSADGTTWGTAFDNLAATTDTKAYVQFGVQARNTSTTTTQDNGMASVKLDLSPV